MIQSTYQSYGGNFRENYRLHHTSAMNSDTKRAESTSQTRNEGDQVNLSEEARLSTSRVAQLPPRGTALVN